MENNSGLGTTLKFDLAPGQSNVIKVIGVGGGGSNAINYMYNQKIKGVDFIICNTDSQALENSPVPTKIQLGVNLTEGLGAGANPEIGHLAAQESVEEIDRVLDKNTKMVFITAGMGGGTGTGAAPVIAELAKNKDILTVGIVTIPFQFEGKVRHEQALIGVENLRKHVDSLIVINNNKLREVYGNLGFKAGYAKSDEVLSTASKGIAEVITQHFTQNIDLRDAKTVLSNSGTAIMGSATATGENRAKEAIMSALDSPLLNENKITGAKNVLLLIVCGTEAEDEITLDEIGEINDFIQSESGNNANIIMGVGEDEKLGNSISVTIIATGFNPEQQSELINKDNVIKHMLGAEQAAVQKLNVNSDVKFAPVNTQPTPVQQPVQNFVQENTQQQNVLDNTIAPIKPARIVHVLDEEVEDFGKKTYNEVNVGASNVTSNMPSPAVNVNSLDVFFEIVEPKVTENQINDFQPEVIVAPIVTDTTIHQNSLNFDIVDSNSQNEIFEITEKQIFNSKTLFFEDEVVPVIPQENVQSPVAQTTPNTEDLVIKHVLDIDTYIKHEENLLNAKPIEEASPKANETIEPALEMTLRTEAPVDFVRDSVENQDNIQNLAYKQELKQTTPSRRQKLKDFNYKFSNNRNPAELDKPAFERLGINIHTDSHKQENVGASRYSVETDNNDLKIRSNNSFLHDNVD
nr:cell division protein FtsZ [uncultured Flavobacterium sp.]